MAATAPPELKVFLKDSTDLCGAWLVHTTAKKMNWLSGRFVSANWDMDELTAKRDEIVRKNALKLTLDFPSLG